MNSFYLIGKCINIENKKSFNIIHVSTSSPFNKNIIIPIVYYSDQSITIKKHDLLGISGFIEYTNNSIYLVSSKIVWLPNK